ncbi:MAG: hypothetical protein HKN51_01610 [Saprospiraceae bacterium]|nr:hypothetical protein [Saprospiraceae bacterium]
MRFKTIIGIIFFSIVVSESLNAQSFCWGNCDLTQSKCYYDTLATPTSQIALTVEGDSICCDGFRKGGSLNYNCAQLFIVAPPGTEGLKFSSSGPNQCAIDVHELQNGCPANRNNGISICDPFCPDMTTYCVGEPGATNIEFIFTLCKEGNFNAIDLLVEGVPKPCLQTEDTNEDCDVTFNVSEGATLSSVPASALSYLSCITCTTPVFTYGGTPVTDCNGISIEYIAFTPPTECEVALTISDTMLVYPTLDGTITDVCEDTCRATITYNPDVVCPDIVFDLINDVGDTIATNTTGIFLVDSDSKVYEISASRPGTIECWNSEYYTANPETVPPDLINFPPDISIYLDSLSIPDTLTTTTGFPEATDNCDLNPAITYTDDVSGLTGCSDTGDIIRTFVATDDCGNISTPLVQTISILDTMPPIILTCPPNIDEITGCDTLDLGSIGGLAYSTTPVIITVAQFTTVGGSYEEANGVTISYSDVISDNTCPNPLIVVWRTFVVTDDCGNSDSCVQVLEFVDYTDPEVTCPPPLLSVDGCDEFDVTEASTGLDYAPVETPVSNAVFISLGGTINDICGFLSITYIDAIVPDLCPAAMLSVTRTFIVTDECDNTDTCQQDIEVYDLSGPEFSGNEDVTVQCDSIPSDDDPIVWDDCSAVTKIYYQEDTITYTCVDEFTLQREWGYEDNCGNESYLVQIITVIDTLPPVVTCPPDVTLTYDNTCIIDTLIGTLGWPTVVEQCTSVNSITYSDDVSGINTFNGHGTIIRTFVVADECGNVITCDQTITLDGVLCGTGCGYIYTNGMIRYNSQRE